MNCTGDGPVHGCPSAGPQRPEDADKDLRSHQHGNTAEGASKRAESLRSLNGYADDLLRNRRRVHYFMSCSKAYIFLKSSKYFLYSGKRGQLVGSK